MCDLLLIWFLKRLILNLTKCHLVPNNHACASTQRITRRICNCRTLHFFIRKYQSFLSIHRAYHQPLKNHNQHISESCQKGRHHRAGSSLKLLKKWEFNLQSYVSMRIVNIWSSKWRNMHTLEEIVNFQVQYWASSINRYLCLNHFFSNLQASWITREAVVIDKLVGIDPTKCHVFCNIEHK